MTVLKIFRTVLYTCQLLSELLPGTMGSLSIGGIFLLLLASASVCCGQNVRANTTDSCSLVMDGEMYQALMLTDPGESYILMQGDACM